MNDTNKEDSKITSIILIGIIITIMLFAIITTYRDINNKKRMEEFCKENGGSSYNKDKSLCMINGGFIFNIKKVNNILELFRGNRLVKLTEEQKKCYECEIKWTK